SRGAHVEFPVDAARPGGEPVISVFTTRPDTLFGATYMVLAPEHTLVESIVPSRWPEGTKPAWTGGYATPTEAVTAYRAQAAAETEAERTAEARVKTGVFTGAYAIN